MRMVSSGWFVAVAACALSVASLALPGSSGSAAPFTLEITAHLRDKHLGQWDFSNISPKAVDSGGSVMIGIRKTNRSGKEIEKAPQNGGPYGYHFEVRDGTGHLLPAKSPQDANGVIKFGGPGHLRGSKDMVLQPSESNVTAIDLSRFFDFSNPGTYSIQVSQHFSSDAGSALLKSNTIKVVVVPAK